MSLKIGEHEVSILSVAIIAALGGSLVTGGTIWAVQKKKEGGTVEILEAISQLESSLEKAEAQAIVNLTAPDLLKVPCSAEYIETNGTLACREMFCRMNLQGNGDGAESSECKAVGNLINSNEMLDKCLALWDENTVIVNANGGSGIDSNSKYYQCLYIFGKNK